MICLPRSCGAQLTLVVGDVLERLRWAPETTGFYRLHVADQSWRIVLMNEHARVTLPYKRFQWVRWGWRTRWRVEK